MCKWNICYHYYCGHRCTSVAHQGHWTLNQECERAKRRKKKCEDFERVLRNKFNIKYDVCDTCKEHLRYFLPQKNSFKYAESPDDKWHVKTGSNQVTIQVPKGTVDYGWVKCLDTPASGQEFKNEQMAARAQGREPINNSYDVEQRANGRPYFNTGGGAHTVPRQGIAEESEFLDQAYNPPPPAPPPAPRGPYDQDPPTPVATIRTGASHEFPAHEFSANVTNPSDYLYASTATTYSTAPAVNYPPSGATYQVQTAPRYTTVASGSYTPSTSMASSSSQSDLSWPSQRPPPLPTYRAPTYQSCEQTRDDLYTEEGETEANPYYYPQQDSNPTTTGGYDQGSSTFDQQQSTDYQYQEAQAAPAASSGSRSSGKKRSSDKQKQDKNKKRS